ncbi:ABC transporter ATP-binding protein [Haliovirga abyssi]|uniref:ABC transporter n=1 Tax=Haliovirga abyssi TaxID=2996794 RepID=A0AAU9D8U2_9FUSO|nr:ABC transporter ATP-binding protein [Haliovirga abyssi]BDU49690.1 ABC transporter [Haliovirga abyssi]
MKLKIDLRVKRALKYIKPYLGLSILSIVLASLAAATAASPIFIIKQVVNDVLMKKNYNMLIMINIAIILIFILKGFVFYYQAYVSAYISNKITFNVRQELFEHLQKLSMGYFAKTEVGELMARFYNDTEKFKAFIVLAFSSIVKLFTILIAVIAIFQMSWKLSIISLIFIPLLSKIVRTFTKKLYKTGGEIQKKIGIITTVIQENLSGIRVVKAFANEDYEIEKFRKINDENFNANIKNVKISSKVTPVVDFFNAVSLVIILMIGGVQVIKGEVDSGQFLAFLTALALLSDPLRVLTSNINKMTTNLSSVERVFEILDEIPEIREIETPITKEEIIGKVDIKDIYFKYDREYVLKNVNISGNPGEVVALVGQSGSGKTTLVNLIPRFYEVEKGEILVDGENIKNLEIKFLRKNIGIVPQETFLFSGTIRENIMYGKRDATFKEVKKAAESANAIEFIEKLPNGFDTEVGERGVLLSGGQKQRIAIARAILKNPKILILDEATSALDTESERLVQDALDKLMKNRTTFVIAHRLSTIINADKIVVMKNGEIQEVGTHKKLLEKRGMYKELYDKQFKN